MWQAPKYDVQYSRSNDWPALNKQEMRNYFSLFLLISIMESSGKAKLRWKKPLFDAIASRKLTCSFHGRGFEPHAHTPPPSFRQLSIFYLHFFVFLFCYTSNVFFFLWVLLNMSLSLLL